MSAAPNDDVMAVQGQCIGYSVLSKSCLFLDLILTKSLDAEHIDPSTGLPEFTPTVAPENDNDAVVNHVGTHVKRHEPIQIPIVRQSHEVISVCLTAASFEGYDALMTTLQKPRIGDVFEGTVQPSTRGKSAKTNDRENVGEHGSNSGEVSNVVVADEPATTAPSSENVDKPWVADKDAKQNVRVTGLTLTLVRRGIIARPGDFGVKWLQRREGAKKKNPPPQPTKDEREAASVTADGLTLISASKRFQVFATFCYRMMNGRYPVFDENLRYQPFTCPLLPVDEAKLPPPPPPARRPQSSNSAISPSAPAEVAPSTSDEKMPELSTASARPNDSSAPETVVSVNGRPQLQSAAPFGVLDVAGGAGRLSCKLRDLGFAPTVIDPRAREMMLGGKAEAGRLSKRQRREIRKAVEKRQREEEGDGDGTNDQPTCDQHQKEESAVVDHAPTAAPTPAATDDNQNEDNAVTAEDAAAADDEDAPNVEDNAGKGNGKVSQPKRSAEWAAAAESLIWQPPSYNDFFVSTDDAQKALISSSDLIVGLHCDGAVNEIIAAACSFRKNFVICACCVFPNQYPRSLQDGTPVVSREELNMWIVEEARRQGFPGTVDTVRLPMHGANQVVFGVVGPPRQ